MTNPPNPQVPDIPDTLFPLGPGPIVVDTRVPRLPRFQFYIRRPILCTGAFGVEITVRLFNFSTVIFVQRHVINKEA